MATEKTSRICEQCGSTFTPQHGGHRRERFCSCHCAAQLKTIDKVGQRFGRLAVLARELPRRWRCQCDCGRIVSINDTTLGRGTHSCGCLRSERISARRRSHGLSKTPEFYAWYDARKRCHDPNSQSFLRYGARGIVMCPEWRTSVEAFYRDMGAKPSRDHTLERTNNDGPYSPSNCVWALPKVQAQNRSTNRLYTYAGETLTLSAWSERLGIKRVTLQGRLDRFGWPIEKAFTAALKRNQHG